MAHHSVLVFNVLGTNEILVGQIPESVADSEPQVIKNLYETCAGVSRKNFQEAYHDVLELKEEAITAFNLAEEFRVPVMMMSSKVTANAIYYVRSHLVRGMT